jgi:hypothetical protein
MTPKKARRVQPLFRAPSNKNDLDFQSWTRWLRRTTVGRVRFPSAAFSRGETPNATVGSCAACTLDSRQLRMTHEYALPFDPLPQNLRISPVGLALRR